MDNSDILTKRIILEDLYKRFRMKPKVEIYKKQNKTLNNLFLPVEDFIPLINTDKERLLSRIT